MKSFLKLCKPKIRTQNDYLRNLTIIFEIWILIF